MRHKPWAHDYLEACPQVSFSGHDYQGNWLKSFPYQKLILEIGCGKGDYLYSMASLNPNEFWVGVEKEENVSAVAQKKIENNRPINTQWIVGDATLIEDWFSLKEVDRIHLNFSDPWPKKSHTKRRLTSDLFVDSLLRILNDEGEIRFKTDNQSLFEYTILLWENYPLELIEFSVDYRRSIHADDVITEYEQRFMDLNQAIYRAVWRKKDVK